MIYLSFSTSKFLTTSNVINVLRQVSYQGIIAVGMTMILIMGQIDLSVGSLVAFAAVVNALFLKSGVAIPLSILATLAITSLWGVLNGYVMARFRMHAFLVTMATMTLIRGVTYTLTGGYPVGGLPQGFFIYGAGQVGFVPLPVIYMFVILAVGAFVLSATPFGRSIYAIGGNEDAARLSGINVMRVKIGVFIVSAFVSAISGLILSSRLMAGSPEIGIGWELDVIAAVIIGGTNIFGGEGNLAGHLPRRSVHRGAYQRNDSLGCHSLHAAGCARPGDPKRRHPQQSSREAIGACHGPSRTLYQDHRARSRSIAQRPGSASRSARRFPLC